MTSEIHSLVVDQGAAFHLRLGYTGEDNQLLDLSSGWNARLVIKESFDDDADILDVTDADNEITLSNGSSGSNLDIYVGKDKTVLWTCRHAVYEVQLWPDTDANYVIVSPKGKMKIRQGIPD